MKLLDTTELAFKSADPSKILILSVSGGRDSTAMALSLWDFITKYPDDYNIRLLFETTGFNKVKSVHIVHRLAKMTGWPLDIVRYQGPLKPLAILKESFYAIPKALEILQLDKNRSYKKVFKCCKLLKKKPAENHIKTFDRNKVIIALGFKDGDRARHRKYRLGQLREWDTFFRTKVNGYTYFYPLRDCQERDIKKILKSFGFDNIESSGCSKCPIFCIAKWDKKDPEASIRSKRYAKQLGISFPNDEQTEIRDYCK